MAEFPQPVYVILGMLRLGARSGYEIKQLAERSTRFFWTISHAQIYPNLKRLEHAGLIRGRSVPRGRQRRRVYELTAEGNSVLEGWLSNNEPLTMELRDLGKLKLFFADALKPHEALELIRTIRRRSEDRLQQLHRESEPGAELLAESGQRFPLLTLRLGFAFHEAMVTACADLERELTDPGRSARG